MILKIELAPEQFASLATFIASKKNQIEAPQGYKWSVVRNGLIVRAADLQFVSIKQSKQYETGFNVTLEVKTDNNATHRSQSEAEHLIISRNHMLDLLDAMGIFPEVTNAQRTQ